MANPARPVFPHRQNSDTTFDSICTNCFATIATSREEADLKTAEDAHICPGFDFGQVMHPMDPSPKNQEDLNK
jgi:hypothetical protein